MSDWLFCDAIDVDILRNFTSLRPEASLNSQPRG